MKITKRQLKRIIKEERANLLNELFPVRRGQQWDPITHEFLGDLVEQAEQFIYEASQLEGRKPAELLRMAADFAEGKR